jgi:hypothetical protein
LETRLSYEFINDSFLIFCDCRMMTKYIMMATKAILEIVIITLRLSLCIPFFILALL